VTDRLEKRGHRETGSSGRSGLWALDWRLAALIALTLALRLPGLDRPLCGNFATKNTVYAMVARNWGEGHAPLYAPTLDCLAGEKRALHLVEWPAPAALAAAGWATFGGSLTMWGRGIAVLASVASVALVYLLARRSFGATVAVWGGGLMVLAPVGVIYGRSFMLELPLVALWLACVYGLMRWCETRRLGWLVLVAVSFALACLTKIYSLLLLPGLVWGLLMWRDGQRLGWERWWAVAALCAALVPAVAWYGWVWQMSSGPEAAQVFYGIRDSAQVHRAPWHWWLSLAWQGQVVWDLVTVGLTPLGLLLALAAMWSRESRRLMVPLLTTAALVLLMPRKFAEMNYYYVLLLPAGAMLAGLGAVEIGRRWQLGARAAWLVAGALLVLSLRWSVGPIWRTADEDRPVLAAAQAVQAVTGDDEPIVTMHGSTLDLLYYTSRVGWTVSPWDRQLAERLDALSQAGARWLVVAGIDVQPATESARQLLATLPCEQAGQGYALYRLGPEDRSGAIGESRNAVGVNSRVGIGIASGRDFDGDGVVEIGRRDFAAGKRNSAQARDEIAQRGQ
jgi:hypothetical protein